MYNGNTFSGPIGVIDEQYALFNGTSLAVYEDDKKIAEWSSVSGQPRYQNPQYQNKKELGPIPAGLCKFFGIYVVFMGCFLSQSLTNH